MMAITDSPLAAKRDDNATLSLVTGNAPAGAMFARYWLPALLAEEVAEPDGTPIRVQMLGRRFVAFRDTSGALGFVNEACPHRLASLALGRNEEGGLRCIYHGWKFDVAGQCVEMPTEPAALGFAQRMRVGAYAVREAGGLIWVYLGPPGHEPAFPAYDWTTQPRDQVAVMKFVEAANYVQVVEGSIDSAHTRFLHRGTLDPKEEATRNAHSVDLAPRLEARDTTYGFRYVALRKPVQDADRFHYVKCTRFVFPSTAVTSRPMEPEQPALSQIFVPIDDTHTMHYSIWHSMAGLPVDEVALRRYYHLEPGVDLDARFRPLRNAENWWGQDRDLMARGDWSGITGLMTQDAACQESMGAIADRTQERLGTSDIAIIRMRKRLLESIRRSAAGGTPIGLESPIAYPRLTSIEHVKTPVSQPWFEVGTYPGEYVDGDAG